MVHDLKILPKYFNAIKVGRKRFELRTEKDRKFSVWDKLRLREYNPSSNPREGAGEYTGREIVVRVTDIQRINIGQLETYAIMSFTIWRQ